MGNGEGVKKRLFREAGLKIVKDLYTTKREIDLDKQSFVEKVEAEIGYPNFIKPANMGSSVGINKAHNKKELEKFIDEALMYDNKILVEQGVEKPHEIECAVLGNDDLKASVLGEVFPNEEFYSYVAKYVSESKTEAPAKLPENIAEEIKKQAMDGFKAVDCKGLARVDFLISQDLSEIYINEINTLPGFTSISMYPKLWEKTGLSYTKLLDELIKLAIDRNNEKKSLKTSFEEAGTWHKK